MSAKALLQQQMKALADPHRLRVFALCRQGEASVAEITEVMGQSQPRVSQHLKHLCDAGLLRRFRDGQRAYYRLPSALSPVERRLIELIPQDDAEFVADGEHLRALRGESIDVDTGDAGRDGAARRAFHRALVEQTVTAPVGDLLDVGCGRGDVLKLLAARARRAVGVDIDKNARLAARAEVLLAGLSNCTLRQGDMYRLPFADESFDTIVLDDVLAGAKRPVAALREAARLLRASGRMLVLVGVDDASRRALGESVAAWCAEAGLRVGSARPIPQIDSRWLLSVATHMNQSAAPSEAA